MADQEIKIEDGGLWIGNGKTIFEDSIILHQHVVHIISRHPLSQIMQF